MGKMRLDEEEEEDLLGLKDDDDDNETVKMVLGNVVAE